MPTPLRTVALAGFLESYRRATGPIRANCDRVIQAIAARRTTPGQRIKPILPSKRYYEARLNRAERLIFRIDHQDLILVEIVSHDEIGRFGNL